MEQLDHPGVNNSYYYLSEQYHLHEDLIFVFGSNLAGIHGKGAAHTALLQYGAKMRVGVGLQGHSYAIPTKNGHIRTLPLSDIKPYVQQFKRFTLEHPEHSFYVTPVGTGLAGYKDQDIAHMFKGCINCWFPLNWKSYLT